tara:strand:- start:162 stop:758 length:597 start_codon:yes stop_codon:yes gene_type:complete
MKFKKIAILVVSAVVLIYLGRQKTSENTEKQKVTKIENFEKQKEEYNKTITLRERYVGVTYTQDFVETNGSPETLEGTNNQTWISYFQKEGITIVMNKKSSKIENICSGKNQNLINDFTLPLSKYIGVRLPYEKYEEKINSILFGGIEMLQENCLNKDCVEYYSKGFTTLSYKEFGDNGYFVTLKKIASGKVPRISEY